MKKRRGFTLVELMVVIGIVAMLIAMSSTAFFGGTRQDSVTKSRDQLRDVLLLARQQACISGKTQVLICWNADAKVKTGKTETTAPQGRYALFESVGNVWKQGNNLYVPFKIQLDAMQALRVGTRLVSLSDPDANKFARVTKLVYDPSITDEEVTKREESAMLKYKYMVGGEEGAEELKFQMTKIAEFSGPLGAEDSARVPLALRTSTTYHLPLYYQFDQGRTVFIFTPDGCLGDGSARSISASPPQQAANSREGTFSISVSSEGEVKVGK